MTSLHTRKFSSRIAAVAAFTIAGMVSGALAASCGSSSAKSSCQTHDKSHAHSKNIVETAVSAGSFNTLAAALKAAGMVDDLQSPGPFTVFAPTDDAFAKLPEGTVEALLNDLPKLRQILKYHVVPGKVMAKDVVQLSSAKTLLGQSVKIHAGDSVRINNASVTTADVACSNGVIHVIDRVIMPKDDIIDIAGKSGSFDTLVAAINAAGLTDTLRSAGPFTVFAPSDAAFARLPEGTVEALLSDLPKLRQILKYHVLPGKVMAKEVVKLSSATTLLGQSVTIRTASPTTVDNATIVKTDIVGANGVIHVIDEVIMPDDDIIDIARKAGAFNTLLTAIDAAGLTDTLRSAGPFTVFAPTDDAFAKLPEGTVQALLKDKEKLTQILTYHVATDRTDSQHLVGMKKLSTVQGQKLYISTDDGVKVNNARVVQADVQAANGLIHVIDTVVIPPVKGDRHSHQHKKDNYSCN